MNTAAQWCVANRQIAYPEAVAAMEARVEAIARDEARELVWLLEHPPLYTAGTSAKDDDLVDRDALPVFRSGRGGQFTYHGPGQRVAYVMLNLKKRGDGVPDLRRFVANLEDWLIQTLAQFKLRGERREGRVGIWIERTDGREDKIAAIGIRVRRGVSYHGISFNIAPDLSHFRGIVPCGIREHGVTSLQALGLAVTMPEADVALRRAFEAVFATQTVDGDIRVGAHASSA